MYIVLLFNRLKQCKASNILNYYYYTIILFSYTILRLRFFISEYNFNDIVFYHQKRAISNSILSNDIALLNLLIIICKNRPIGFSHSFVKKFYCLASFPISITIFPPFNTSSCEIRKPFTGLPFKVTD